MAKERGIESLSKLGGMHADPGHKRASSPEDGRVRRLALQVKYFEAENVFLAKIRAKRAESNSGQMKNSRSLES